MEKLIKLHSFHRQ